jgi:hypothetical protein
LIPLVLALLGVVALTAAALLLRAVGPAYRVGRLLAATPAVTLAEALDMARQGDARYVRVNGRVSSEEEFPDEHDRPLVYRRRRLEVSAASGWREVSDEREAVPFGLELRSDFIAVDGAALDEGLVVIGREALGTAADLPPELSRELDPATPVRLWVEQVSAVEHATVAGVPVAGADGQPVLTAGLERPLILTTLELPAAMRVLARGRRRLVVAAAIMLLVGPALLAVAVVAAVAFG